MSKKVIIILSIIAVILLIGIIVIIVLSANTDLFKSNSQMFEKYLEKNVKNIYKVMDISKEEQYLNVLKDKSYIDNTSAVLKYTNSTENEETFNLSINGSTSNQNHYRKINIKYGESVDVSNIEVLKEGNMYGAVFSDIIKQFASVDLTNKKETLNKLSIKETMFDEIKNKYRINDVWGILSKNKENIINAILNYKSNINDNQYTSQNERVITLSNGKSVNTKAYILKLDNEQTRKLIREIFKQLGDQDVVDEINNRTEEFPALTIILYTENGETLRTTLEYENNSITIDLYENEINIDFNQNEIIFNMKINGQTKNIKYTDNKNNKIDLALTTNYTETEGIASIALNIQNESIKGIDINLEQKIQLNNAIQLEKSFETAPNVNLNNLEGSNLYTALSSLFEKINSKLQGIQNSNINSELIDMWIKTNKEWQTKYDNLLNSKDTKFNNQFSLYQGQNVSKNAIYNLLDVIGKNIYGYKEHNSELKIYIQEGHADMNMAEKLKEVVKSAKANYNVNFEYGVDGKISVVLLEQYKEQR